MLFFVSSSNIPKDWKILLIVVISIWIFIRLLRIFGLLGDHIESSTKISNSAETDSKLFGVTKDLWKAIEKSNIIDFERLITKDDININSYDSKGNSILYLAVSKGSDVFLDYLLEKYTDIQVNIPNIQTKKAESIQRPIGLAVQNKDIEKTTTLLQHGADINSTVSNKTILDQALDLNCIKIVELLLKKGADIKLGRPLRFAAKSCDIDTVKSIIRAGADLNYGDPLAAAAAKNRIEIVDLLIKEKVKPSESGALIGAVENNYTEIATILISRGANVNVKKGEYTAYMYADENGNDLLKILLSNKGAKEIHVSYFKVLPSVPTVYKCGYCGNESYIGVKGGYCSNCGSYWKTERQF